MTSDRWRQVEALFHEAAVLSPPEREEWLAGQCTGDAELAREVRRMLDADAADRGTIESLIGDSVNAWLDRPAGSTPERVGAWRIIKPIGTGGMGAVYLAARDDDSYRLLAAVKILRPEQLAPNMRDRFRQERQILAELDHPNIARLLDGGATSEGRPYLVIEYVDGIPLSTYAGKLPLRERCTLFSTVCDAVAFAHRNLIVHRDLKPANILVDTRGVPKLLDFGIAKLIGVDHGMTASMHAMFTPDYASPEQICGEAITTATDVYALGAVLFELITGRPIRSGANRSFADLVNEVTSGTIPAPSRVAAERIPVDLDRIVEKALALEPSQRYGSADQLAGDLRRFLDGRPVEAHGHSWFYSASKFARRHRMAIAGAVVLVCGLTASTAVSMQQAKLAATARVQAEQARAQAERERDRAADALAEAEYQKTVAEKNAAESTLQRISALNRFHSARKLTHKFLFDIEDALKDTVGATKARHVLVSTALEHFEQMGKEIGNDPALIRDLARAYARIGDVQGNSGTANLGDYKGAVESYRQSLQWWRKLKKEPNDVLAAGDTTVKLAKSLKWIDRIPEADAAFAQAAELYGLLKTLLPPSKQMIAVVSRSNLYRAWSEQMQLQDRHEKVREVLTASVAELQGALVPDPSNVFLQRGLAADSIVLSRSLMALQDWPEALRNAEVGLSVIRKLIGPKPPIREQSRLLPPALQLADALYRAPSIMRDIGRAIALDQEMIGIAEKLVALDAANGRNQFLLANALSAYGEHLRADWRWPEAKSAYERAVTITGALLEKSPGNGYYEDLLGTDLVLHGQLLFDLHEDSIAVRDLQRGASILEKSVAQGRLANKPSLQIAREYLALLQHP